MCVCRTERKRERVEKETYWKPVRMMRGSFNMDGTDSSINE